MSSLGAGLLATIDFVKALGWSHPHVVVGYYNYLINSWVSSDLHDTHDFIDYVLDFPIATWMEDGNTEFMSDTMIILWCLLNNQPVPTDWTDFHRILQQQGAASALPLSKSQKKHQRMQARKTAEHTAQLHSVMNDQPPTPKRARSLTTLPLRLAPVPPVTS